MFFRETGYLLKRCFNLLTLNQAIQLFKITKQFVATKLDFLAGSAGTLGIRIERHEKSPYESVKASSSFK
jgi:hypothetical protein